MPHLVQRRSTIDNVTVKLGVNSDENRLTRNSVDSLDENDINIEMNNKLDENSDSKHKKSCSIHVTIIFIVLLLILILIIIFRDDIFMFEFGYYFGWKWQIPDDLFYCDLTTDTFHRSLLLKEYAQTNLPSFEIDIVITWNGDFTYSNNELEYCLKSIYKYIPWYNHIYIVAPALIAQMDEILLSQHIPWLSQNYRQNSNLTFVNQDLIFSLPKYIKDTKNSHNSQAIELMIHNIENLNEHFVYLCDDFIFGNYIPYTYFFNENGTRMRFPSKMIEYYRKYAKNELLYNGYYYNFDLHWNSYNDFEMIHKFIDNKEKLLFANGKRVNMHLEHHPRPYIKSFLVKMEKEYNEWFMYVQTHKKRFSAHFYKDHTSIEELLHLQILKTMIDGSINNQAFYNHSTVFEVLSLQNSQFLAKNDFQDKQIFHYWLYHKKNEKTHKLFEFLNEILCLKPLTFCINDDFDENRESINYQQQKQILITFFECYFENVSPPWQKKKKEHKEKKEDTKEANDKRIDNDNVKDDDQDRTDDYSHGLICFNKNNDFEFEYNANIQCPIRRGCKMMSF